MKKDVLKLYGMHDGATPSVFRNAAKLRAPFSVWESTAFDTKSNQKSNSLEK